MTPLSGASMRPSVSISAPSRRPRSRSPSWRRSPSGCGKNPNKCRSKSRSKPRLEPSVRWSRPCHEIRSGRPQGGHRRNGGAYHPPGRVGAQEGHADRPGRSGRSGSGRHQGHRGGAARSRRRVGRCRRRRDCRSDRRRRRACRSRLYRPRQSVRAGAGRAGGRQAGGRPAQPRRRSHHRRDASRPSSRWWPAR